MNPAADRPDIAAAVDAAVGNRHGHYSWLWWQRQDAYVRAIVARERTQPAGSGGHGISAQQHAWILLDRPDLHHSPHDKFGEWPSNELLHLFICYGALDHALTHGTWTAAHQTLTNELEPDHTNENVITPWLSLDWRRRLEIAAADITIDIGDTPTRRDDDTPAGIGWPLHQPAPMPNTIENADELWAIAIAEFSVCTWEHTLLEQRPDPDDWTRQARIRVATDDTVHVALWAAANPDGLDAIWDAADTMRANTGSDLAARVTSWLICQPTVPDDIVARIPAGRARNLHPANAPALTERFPALASDPAGALWDSWGGTIGELADTVTRLNAR